MPFNILLLPLLGGFIFISRFNCTKWYALRAEKERLILYAAIAGLASVIVAYILKLFVAPWLPCGPEPDTFCIPVWWAKNIPFDYSGISMAAFLLGATLWIPLNELGPWSSDEQNDRVVAKQGTALEQFLSRSMKLKRHVLVSVKGGKVYVGRVVDAFEPADRDPNILLLPTLSGYRGKDDQMICWTLNYDGVYSDIAKERDQGIRRAKMAEFGIVMPITEITSITSFSYEVYQKYFAEYSKGDITV